MLQMDGNLILMDPGEREQGKRSTCRDRNRLALANGNRWFMSDMASH